jgi:hypothetical protein
VASAIDSAAWLIRIAPSVIKNKAQRSDPIEYYIV